MRHPSLLLLLVGLAGAANRTAENAANGWGRWTIKDGKNETVYFNCSLTAKDGELGACDTMVGHGRGTCYKNQVVVLPGAAGKLHMTGDQYVCGCYRVSEVGLASPAVEEVEGAVRHGCCRNLLDCLNPTPERRRGRGLPWYLTDVFVPASLCIVLHVVCWITGLSCPHPLTIRR
jgi:hypothetical protein